MTPELIPPRTIDTDRIEAAVHEMLLAIGEDPDRPGLRETPKRVARMYEEIAAGSEEEAIQALGTQFEEEHQEMVVLSGHEEEVDYAALAGGEDRVQSMAYSQIVEPVGGQPVQEV